MFIKKCTTKSKTFHIHTIKNVQPRSYCAVGMFVSNYFGGSVAGGYR